MKNKYLIIIALLVIFTQIGYAGKDLSNQAGCSTTNLDKYQKGYTCAGTLRSFRKLDDPNSYAGFVAVNSATEILFSVSTKDTKKVLVCKLNPDQIEMLKLAGGLSFSQDVYFQVSLTENTDSCISITFYRSSSFIQEKEN